MNPKQLFKLIANATGWFQDALTTKGSTFYPWRCFGRRNNIIQVRKCVTNIWTKLTRRHLCLLELFSFPSETVRLTLRYFNEWKTPSASRKCVQSTWGTHPSITWPVFHTFSQTFSQTRLVMSRRIATGNPFITSARYYHRKPMHNKRALTSNSSH